MTFPGAFALGITPDAAPEDPLVNIPSTYLLFRANAATGNPAVTAQADDAGNGSLTLGAAGLARLGGGNRYGRTTLGAGQLRRTPAHTFVFGTAILRGRLFGGVLTGLGEYRDSLFSHSDLMLWVSGGSIILQGLRAGGGTLTRSFPHGAIADDVSTTFATTQGTGNDRTDFYLNGGYLGTDITPGESFQGGNTWTHIGARTYTTAGDGQSRSARGAFIGGLLAEDETDGLQQANAHAWLVANAPD